MTHSPQCSLTNQWHQPVPVGWLLQHVLMSRGLQACSHGLTYLASSKCVPAIPVCVELHVFPVCAEMHAFPNGLASPESPTTSKEPAKLSKGPIVSLDPAGPAVPNCQMGPPRPAVFGLKHCHHRVFSGSGLHGQRTTISSFLLRQSSMFWSCCPTMVPV